MYSPERRLGPAVFRDMLGLHFSSTRPVEDELTEHPLAEFVIAAISDAQDAGRVPPEADASELAVFFLTGLFALLATGAHDSDGEGPVGPVRDDDCQRNGITMNRNGVDGYRDFLKRRHGDA